MKIRIKRKLGFCEKKGCWNQYSASLDIHGSNKDGEQKGSHKGLLHLQPALTGVFKE